MNTMKIKREKQIINMNEYIRGFKDGIWTATGIVLIISIVSWMV